MSGEKDGGASPATVDLDFEEIEAAVMESPRGRWFLGEFARRNRNADTERLLAAIRHIEANIQARPAVTADPEAEGMRRAICEMADEIASAKREIASIRIPGAGGEGDIADATAELDAIVTSTETATSEILGAAEQIQELAWTLREEGVADHYCDALDVRATEIYTACSFQDITGQRTSKVVRVLQMLDTRINTMAELWSGAVPRSTLEKTDASSDRHLLNGPALEGQGVGQDEVDRMMAEAGPVEFHDAREDSTAADAPAGAEADPAETDAVDLDRLSQKDYDALFA